MYNLTPTQLDIAIERAVNRALELRDQQNNVASDKELQFRNLPDLLTRQQTATLLGVSLSTLWAWDNKGILQPTRIGSRVRYSKSQIQKMI